MHDLHVRIGPDVQILVQGPAPQDPQSVEKRLDGRLLIAGVVSEVEIDFRANFGVRFESLEGQVVQFVVEPVADEIASGTATFGQVITVAHAERGGLRWS